MSWYSKDNDEEADAEGEGEDEENDYKNINDKIIFLIDAREDMFQRNNQNEIKFQNCLKLALQVMMSKVIANDNSSIGLVFFGTREKNKENGIDGIYTVFPPEIPSASKMRQLQAFIDDLDLFHCDIGSLPNSSTTSTTSSTTTTTIYCPLREALWVCSQAFHTVASTLHKANDFKRVWIFTNDDNPNKQSKINQEKTIKVAQDCGETGIEISLFHLDSKNKPATKSSSSSLSFNPDLFYTKLLLCNTLDKDDNPHDDNDDDIANRNQIEMRIQGSGEDGFDTMMVHVRRKMFRKRALETFFLSFGNSSNNNNNSSSSNSSSSSSSSSSEVCMSFKLYKLLSISKRPIYKWLYAQTNEPLKVMTFYIDSYTGEALSDDKIDTCIEFSQLQIPFTSKEMKAAKKGIMKRNDDDDDDDDISGSSNILQSNDDDDGEEEEEEGNTISKVSILCFIPRKNLPEAFNLESSYFLYPDESTVKGSKNLYAFLLHYLYTHQLVALVRFSRTFSSVPRLAALIPSLNSNNDCNNDNSNGDNSDQSSSSLPSVVLTQGLHLVSLPFQEEIRRNPDPVSADILKLSNNNKNDDDDVTSTLAIERNKNTTSNNNNPHTNNENDSDNRSNTNNNPELKAAEDLIDAFQLNRSYHHNITNTTNTTALSESYIFGDGVEYWQYFQAPAMQQFYSVLQAVALSQTTPEWISSQHDNLHSPFIPSSSSSSSSLVMVLNQFQQTFGLSEGAIHDMMESSGAKTTANRKRKADTSSSSAVGGEADDSVLGGRSNWKEMAQTNTLGKLTVADLKSICSALSIPVSGTKAVLVDRITTALI